MNYAQNNWRSLFAALSIVAGSLLIGCQSNNNSYDNGPINSEAPAGDATTMDSTQGTAVNESPTSGDHTSERPMDNTVVPGADRRTDNSNVMPRKKGTRGKASLNMKDMPVVKTSVAVRDADGVYSRADIAPMYPGGEDALRRYVEDNIEYPEDAIEQGAEGDIRIAFTVDEKGNVTNVKAMNENNTEYTLKQEAIDVISKMPDWTPGKVKGKAVKTRMYMPISFQIIE